VTTTTDGVARDVKRPVPNGALYVADLYEPTASTTVDRARQLGPRPPARLPHSRRRTAAPLRASTSGKRSSASVW